MPGLSAEEAQLVVDVGPGRVSILDSAPEWPPEVGQEIGLRGLVDPDFDHALRGKLAPYGGAADDSPTERGGERERERCGEAGTSIRDSTCFAFPLEVPATLHVKRKLGPRLPVRADYQTLSGSVKLGSLDPPRARRSGGPAFYEPRKSLR